MAMIPCPNCGQQISDKSPKCIHCGYQLIEEEKLHCIECGAELESGTTICPKCGCPVEVKQDAPQKVKVTGVKVNHNGKKIIVGVIIALIVLILAVFGLKKVNEKKEMESIQNYNSEVKTAVATMLVGAADAENCGNSIKQVWSNAIKNHRDFNTALKNLFKQEKFIKQINDIKENQNTVKRSMKNLNNPPEECEKIYNELSNLYNAYTSLTNFVINPSGSLQTFSNGFNEADEKVANCFDAISIYM